MDLTEALAHIPRGSPASPQNELRMVFTILLQSNDRKGIATANVLAEALADVGGRYPGYEFNVESAWFAVEDGLAIATASNTLDSTRSPCPEPSRVRLECIWPDCAIGLLLVGFAGFRGSELVSLDVEDFEESEDGVRIRRGKGDQEGPGLA
jgi:hypothetical protein